MWHRFAVRSSAEARIGEGQQAHTGTGGDGLSDTCCDLGGDRRFPQAEQQRSLGVATEDGQAALGIFDELVGQRPHPIGREIRRGFNDHGTHLRMVTMLIRRRTLGPMRRIMVTGAASWVGGRLIQRLEGLPGVEVIAVDELPATVEFRTPLHDLAIDELEFAHFFLDTQPHVLIHLQALDRAAILGREKSHSRVVMGAQGLFGALQRCTVIEKVIVKSDSAFYGAGPRQPSLVHEDSSPRRSTSAYSRSIRDMEDLLNEVSVELPNVEFTTLRFAPIIGLEISNPLSTYLRLPLVPTVLGYDPRMQLIHEEDAVSALLHAVASSVPGTFNIAAEGQLYLSRVLRLGRRVPYPLPPPQFRTALRGLRRLGNRLPGSLEVYLRYGRVMDIRRMIETYGWQPRLTARQAVLATFGRIEAAGTTR